MYHKTYTKTVVTITKLYSGYKSVNEGFKAYYNKYNWMIANIFLQKKYEYNSFEDNNFAKQFF